NTINWNYSAHKKLWTYNLNYFDYLLQEKLTKETGLQLIHQYINDFSWIKDGKEPYPTSLRIINWIKFCLKLQIHDHKINTAIHNQAIHLSKNLEYHLLANHLLENAFALTIAATYLGEKRLFNKASNLLLSQLKEQILPDGAHYERSPMYHQIILYRLLDTINIISALAPRPEIKQKLISYAASMLGWMHQITFTNNQLPLFKDSANGIAPDCKELTDYAKRLNIPPVAKSLKESGYRKLVSDDIEILIDAGNISPSYQPGHAHADHLSYELYYKGIPVIIDTGTSTYNTGEIRTFERSTGAHNTITVDNQNSSEVWASHRVGARALVILNEYTDRNLKATLIFSKNKFKHKRNIELSNKELRIIDNLEVTNREKIAVSNIHLHPDRKIKKTENAIFIDDTIQLEFHNADSITIQPFYHALEFNKRIESQVIRISFNKKLETRVHVI
ncbi:MAG TPA: alginate lyase family protein, partial [Bacteroidales bacterium]|nr:alginate lyase family protein [Bacteroidales bacterium]